MHFNIQDGIVSDLNVRTGAGSKGEYAIPNFRLEGVDGGDFDFLGLPEDKFDEPEDVIADGDRLSVLYQGKLKKHTIAKVHYNYRTKTMHETEWKIGFILLAVLVLMFAFLFPMVFTLVKSGVGPIKSFGIACGVPTLLIAFTSFEMYQSYAASRALKSHCQNSHR